MRLRRLTADDRPGIVRMLAGHPALHLPILAGLARLVTDPGVAGWILAGQGGQGAVLLYDHGDWSLANPGGADLYPLLPVLANRTGRLRGEAAAVGALARHFRPGVAAADRTCLLVRLQPEDGRMPAARGTLRPLDAGETASLAAEHRELAAGLARAGRAGRAAGLFADGALAALVWSEAEAAGQALIGGIWTLPSLRRQGWGTACLGSFCRLLGAERLVPHLAYDDPILGRLAGKLGATPGGRWREIELQKAGR